MRDELIKLADAVMAKKKWAPSTFEKAFGIPGFLHTLKHGKFGPGFTTADRFKRWCEDQLRDKAA